MALQQPGKTVSDAILAEIVRRVVDAVAPERTILFGSAARGEMGPDSDVDLLVIKAGCTGEQPLRRSSAPLSESPSPLMSLSRGRKTLSATRKQSGLIYRPALREGKVIYAA